MPSVLFAHMHPRDFDFFTVMFNSIGWKVYIPSDKEPNYFGYGLTIKPSRGEATPLTYAEVLDIKPDVVLCLCYEQLSESRKLSQKIGAKFVVRTGNNNIPYNKQHSDFLISNDTYTYINCDIPNKLFFYMPPDYGFYCKQPWYNDSRLVTSYIHFYDRYWKDSWSIYNNIKRNNKDFVFINFGVNDNPIDNLNITEPADIVRTLGISRGLLHVKEQEGYGWSLLEAISCGIPVIAFKPYVVGKTCEHFLIEGITAILINNSNEFRNAILDVDTLSTISEKGHKFIREFINEEEQYSKIKTFFEEVVLA